MYGSDLDGIDSEAGDLAFDDSALNDLALDRAFGSMFQDELGHAGALPDEPNHNGGGEFPQSTYAANEYSANGYDTRFDEGRFDDTLDEPEDEQSVDEGGKPSRGWLSGRLSNRLNRLIDPDFDDLDKLDQDEGSLAGELLDDDQPVEDPIALRSLRWLKKNVSGFKVTVSVQRGGTAHLPHPQLKPRKFPQE